MTLRIYDLRTFFFFAATFLAAGARVAFGFSASSSSRF